MVRKRAHAKTPRREEIFWTKNLSPPPEPKAGRLLRLPQTKNSNYID